MHLRSLVAATALLLGSLAAHADTYQYTVFFDGSGFSSTAVFTVPSLIGTFTSITNLTGNSNYGSLLSVDVYPIADGCPLYAGHSCFATDGSAGGTSLYFNGDVNSVGVFTDVFGDGSVTIASIPDVATTPEPSSFYLLGTGLLGVAGVLRKRFA